MFILLLVQKRIRAAEWWRWDEKDVIKEQNI